MKIAYKEMRFYKKTIETIATASGVIDEFVEQGYKLTVRQLFYQLVAREYIPNTQAEYEKLSRTISNARLAGLIDWDHIVDRTRYLRENSHWSTPGQIIQSAADSFQLDKWKDQPYRVEVWIEKDALIGVIEDICTKMDMPHFSCRGYVSQSAIWRAGQRLKGYVDNGQTPVVLHLGDHDSSGIDMTRDIRERLGTFSQIDCIVERLALNRDQIREYALPPNPAKEKDSRSAGYIAEHGSSTWELDALNPTVIAGLIDDAVGRYRNDELWLNQEKQEIVERDLLQRVADNWNAVSSSV